MAKIVQVLTRPSAEYDLPTAEAQVRDLDAIVEKLNTTFQQELKDEVGKINFLNIDVEGINNKILSEADLSIIDPEIICVEDTESFFVKDEKLDFFKDKGYQLVFQSGMNKIFAKI